MLRLAVLALTCLLLVHMLDRDREGGWSPPAIVVVSAPPVVVNVPPAPPPPPVSLPPPPPAPPPAPSPPPAPVVDDREGLGPCPAPYRKATDVAIVAPAGLDVSAATASAYDVRLIAAWNGEDVMLSVDEGRTWKKVLAREGNIADAAFDCHGRLHVLHDSGDLGTYDDALAEPERWTHLDSLGDDGDDHGRLIADGGGVAIIGTDVAANDHLVLVRKDARGRWRSAPLVHDEGYGSWDGMSIMGVEPLGGGRFRMLAMPWQGGECGYSSYLDVTFDLALRAVHYKRYGEEESPAHWDRPDPEGASLLARDRAGRWLALSRPDDGPAQLVRLDAAAVAVLRHADE